jgi:hypothetical protein
VVGWEAASHEFSERKQTCVAAERDEIEQESFCDVTISTRINAPGYLFPKHNSKQRQPLQ